jgi:hypothetical protein
MGTSNQRPDDLHPYQFRLRTALGVVTAVALFFSVVTWLRMPGWVAAGSAIFGLTIVIVWSSRQVGLYLGAIFLYLAMYGWMVARFGWQSSGPSVWLIVGLPASLLFCGMFDSARRQVFNPFNRK